MRFSSPAFSDVVCSCKSLHDYNKSFSVICTVVGLGHIMDTPQMLRPNVLMMIPKDGCLPGMYCDPLQVRSKDKTKQVAV